MTREEAVRLAVHVARRVFEADSDPHVAITRIQFMSGEWPDKERPRGGLCESALAGVITDALLSAGQSRIGESQ